MHETSTDIRNFDRVLNCACNDDHPINEACPQYKYLKNQCSLLWKGTEDDLLLVDFGSCRSLAAVSSDAVYLFSTIGKCSIGGSGKNVGFCNRPVTSQISCNDCRRQFTESVHAPQSGSNGVGELQCSLTLLEVFNRGQDGDNLFELLQEAQDVAYSVAELEGIIGTQLTLPDSSTPEELDEYANELIQRCKNELISQCSSLIGEVNSFCQPPLIVNLRWLKHCATLEYLVEYSADLSQCFFDEFSQKHVPDVSNETRILHELLQVSSLTKSSIDGLFHYCITRLGDYLGLRRSSPDAPVPQIDSEVTTQAGSEAVPNPDVCPYWWSFYNNANTYGESDGNIPPVGMHECGKRLTRSQLLKLQDEGQQRLGGIEEGGEYDDEADDEEDEDDEENVRTPITKKRHQKRLLSKTLLHSQGPCALDDVVCDETVRRKEATVQFCYCSKCIEPMCAISRIFDAAIPSIMSRAILGNAEVTVPPRIDYPSLKHSILSALEAGNAISKCYASEPDQMEQSPPESDVAIEKELRRLNTALLSAFRLGEVMLGRGEPIPDQVKCEFEDLVDIDMPPPSTGLLAQAEIEEMLLNNRLLYASLEDHVVFENDVYFEDELVSDVEPNVSTSSVPMPPKSRSKSKRVLVTTESTTAIPSTRTRKREVWKDYIYDTYTSDVDDWYEDSDASSSKKSKSSSQRKATPASRPSQTNLSEIYGDQDALIPMGPLPIGVYFDASRKLWRCQWRENGKFRTKGFSLGHYSSLSDARHACIVFRCQVGNIPVQPEWLTPNYIQVSELLSRKSNAQQGTATTKKSKRRRSSDALEHPRHDTPKPQLAQTA
ncbi:AP2-ERF domain [Babesia duncani]|uniref:AP2-ERF domain n=1 Tax=Babesia duncani TaxID=323732 RepID=A0AAD9PNB5_9APIC|nr:AP2-ERF domain [Babesia duncani]